MTNAVCPDLAATNCPCLLSLLNQCTYCTLLQGKTTCNCSWDGNCAYHYFPWQEISVPDVPDNTLLIVIKKQNIWQLLLKADKSLLAAPLGSIFSIDAQTAVARRHFPQAILLNKYPQLGLAYLVSFAAYPFSALEHKTIVMNITGNAFQNYDLLKAPRQEKILLLAEKKFHDILLPLIMSLKNRNTVTLGNIDAPLTWQDSSPDIVLLAGSADIIHIVLPQISAALDCKCVLWII